MYDISFPLGKKKKCLKACSSQRFKITHQAAYDKIILFSLNFKKAD